MYVGVNLRNRSKIISGALSTIARGVLDLSFFSPINIARKPLMKKNESTENSADCNAWPVHRAASGLWNSRSAALCEGKISSRLEYPTPSNSGQSKLCPITTQHILIHLIPSMHPVVSFAGLELTNACQ